MLKTASSCRGAFDVRRPRPLRTFGHLELDSITVAQIRDALTIDCALVKEIFLPRFTPDESKAFVHSQRPNCSRHLSISDLLTTFDTDLPARPGAAATFAPEPSISLITSPFPRCRSALMDADDPIPVRFRGGEADDQVRI
jgi:hypothetical protein